MTKASAIELRPVDPDQLRAIAAGEQPLLELPALAGALAPPFVAARALAHLAAGKAAGWCSPFHIVRAGVIVGGCGFKDEPSAGAVEFGYAVAAECRNQGIGRAAVAKLIDIAFASAAVERLQAHVSPHNLPSLRVLERLGFVVGAGVFDADGEWVLDCTFQPGRQELAGSASPSNPEPR